MSAKSKKCATKANDIVAESANKTKKESQSQQQEISKKAAKKEAAKAEKLRRRQEAAAATATAAATSGIAGVSVEGPDPLAENYGDLRPETSFGRVWTDVSSLTDELKDNWVLVCGRAHAIRARGNKMAFLTVRQGCCTVQCVLTVAPDLVSTEMVKFATRIPKDSIIEIEGIVTVPPNVIKDASQQVEIQIRKIYCVERAAADSSDNCKEKTGVNQQQKRIIIENKHGEKLVGVLHETGSTEIVILCHGFRSSKDCSTMMTLASALEKEGISAFRFDFAGNGESGGCFQYGGYRREADDLLSVVQHFHGENRLITAILGHSKGGNVVLLYASKYHDVRHVINVSGRYNTKGGVEERLGKGYLERVKKDGFIDVKSSKSGEFLYRVTEESLMDRLNTNMHEACLQIDKDCKVLTVHGSSDELLGVEDALGFAKIIPNHKLHIIEGADHVYSNHSNELTSTILSFIKQHMQGLTLHS